jgi:hypothetical protein
MNVDATGLQRCLLDLGKVAHVTDFLDSWSLLLRVLLIALCA